MLPLLLPGQEIWTGLNARLELSEKLSLSSENQIRLEEETYQAQSAFTELGIRLAPSAKWYTQVQGRYQLLPGLNRKRLAADLGYEFGSRESKWNPGVRLRFQTAGYSWEPEISYFRLNLTNEYSHTRVTTPYFSTEWFYRLGNKPGLRTLRATAGIKSEFSFVRLDGFYRMEFPLRQPEEITSYIVGLSATFRLIRKDKRIIPDH